VLRLVTAFSIIGVAAGVATLVIALAIEHRFPRNLAGSFVGRHRTRVTYSSGRRGHSGLQNDGIQTCAIPGVRSVTPAAYQTVLMTFAGAARGVVTKGIDLESERRSDEALQHIIAGTLDFSPDRTALMPL